MANFKNLMKTAAGYGLIVAAGLGVGYAVSVVPAMLKPAYVEGNYSAYFPNAQTRVVLYGTAWCQYCAKARDYLKANNVPYVDLDIEKSEPARKQHAALGGGGVPMLLVGDRKMTGFNQSALQSAIKELDG